MCYDFEVYITEVFTLDLYLYSPIELLLCVYTELIIGAQRPHQDNEEEEEIFLNVLNRTGMFTRDVGLM